MRIREHLRSRRPQKHQRLSADVTSWRGVRLGVVRVSEHRAVTQHSLSSRREELQQPEARIRQHHVPRLQPQTEGAAVGLASLDGNNTNPRRPFSHHQPTPHLHSRVLCAGAVGQLAALQCCACVLQQRAELSVGKQPLEKRLSGTGRETPEQGEVGRCFSERLRL